METNYYCDHCEQWMTNENPKKNLLSGKKTASNLLVDIPN